MPRLAGKSTFVTGGGSGAEHAIALEFAAQGAAAVVADRNGATARKTVASIAGHVGRPSRGRRLRGGEI